MAASAGRTAGRRIQAVSSISCSIGRRPFSNGAAASSAMRAGALGEARSVQPTTPRTRPAEPRATSSMKVVSASLSAACTRTVAVMSPKREDAGRPARSRGRSTGQATASGNRRGRWSRRDGGRRPGSSFRSRSVLRQQAGPTELPPQLTGNFGPHEGGVLLHFGGGARAGYDGGHRRMGGAKLQRRGLDVGAVALADGTNGVGASHHLGFCRHIVEGGAARQQAGIVRSAQHDLHALGRASRKQPIERGMVEQRIASGDQEDVRPFGLEAGDAGSTRLSPMPQPRISPRSRMAVRTFAAPAMASANRSLKATPCQSSAQS